jgi:predicted P-loop ATPase
MTKKKEKPEAEIHEFKVVPPDENDFERNVKGNIIVSQRNVAVALRLMGVSVSHDIFSDCGFVEGLDGFSALNDGAINRLRFAMEQKYKFAVGKDYIFDAIGDLARLNRFHPVLDFLAAQALVWDGTKRLDKWLVSYCGADDTPYVRTVGAKTLIAAVKRIRHPGCKFDEMLVLIGPQGIGKSTAIKLLAVRDEWYSDGIPLGSDEKKLMEQAAGRWIVEAPEMRGLGKTGLDPMKAMLSRATDSSRLAFGRIRTDMRRHFIIIGTTNNDRFLNDYTGNRRYWPAGVGALKLDDLARDVNQLWAEAAVREAEGESINLPEELWPEATAEQERRRVIDAWEDEIVTTLGDRQGKITKTDVREIVKRFGYRGTNDDDKKLTHIMMDQGWRDNRLRFEGERRPCWSRGSEEKAFKTVLQWRDGKLTARIEEENQPL